MAREPKASGRKQRLLDLAEVVRQVRSVRHKAAAAWDLTYAALEFSCHGQLVRYDRIAHMTVQILGGYERVERRSDLYERRFKTAYGILVQLHWISAAASRDAELPRLIKAVRQIGRSASATPCPAGDILDAPRAHASVPAHAPVKELETAAAPVAAHSPSKISLDELLARFSPTRERRP